MLASGLTFDQGLRDWRNVFLEGDLELPLGESSVLVVPSSLPVSGSVVVIPCPTSGSLDVTLCTPVT